MAQETPSEAAPNVAPNGESHREADGEFLVWREFPWALGGSFEVGTNTRESASTGYGVSIDAYLFTPFVALGVRGNMHDDGVSLTATELLFNVRGYVPIVNSPALGASLFAQMGFGASSYSEEERRIDTYTMDLTAGCRLYFYRGILRGFYIEPYVRGGFPFMFSGGIAAGHWFNF